MKRLYLQQIKQHDCVYYIGEADPRDLVRIAKKIEVSTPQETQRPLSGKRVKSIASYVDEPNGILPNTLVIATSTMGLGIHETSVIDETGVRIPLFYIDFPCTNEEFEKCKDAIDVLDGQHRLYSFAEEFRTLKDDIPFSIGFTLFITPTIKDRQKIFMVCNEKQEKVSGNLLMWFKEKLNMLQGAELTFYPLVNSLNTENASPLKGRIVMGGETVTRGIKAQQLIKVLNKADIQNLSAGGKILDDSKRFNLICTYLKGWEKVCDFSLADPSPKDGASCKIAGLRFMLLLLPAFYDRSINQKEKFTEGFVEDTLRRFLSTKGIPFNEFFTCHDHSQLFRAETATIEFAKRSANEIKTMGSGEFDPFA